MTATIGALSAGLVSLIAVAGVAALIGLVVLVALLLDVPKRKQRKNNKGILSAEEMAKKSLEVDNAEKGGVEVAVTILPSVKSGNSRYQSSEATRVPTPPAKCQCKHPRKG
ncbi:hypothetical protein PTNB73_08144 [Pyrenophora teres f. teres]|nr:hypothetical protein HRS9122_07396 [Pyrenophora teres f. teres]KAE8860534.1 hypothetical protein PTNB73_08144 [Pyrenophora teres f. teres]